MCCDIRRSCTPSQSINQSINQWVNGVPGGKSSYGPGLPGGPGGLARKSPGTVPALSGEIGSVLLESLRCLWCRRSRQFDDLAENDDFSEGASTVPTELSPERAKLAVCGQIVELS